MRECDIVMKGGITSGVVYPLTVVELAKKFRFRNIGGLGRSPGSGDHPAAEFNRAGGGFERVERIPGEVAKKLRGFFQPVPRLAPLFEVLMAGQAKRGGAFAALRAAAFGYWQWTLGGLALGVALAWLCWLVGLSSFLLPARLASPAPSPGSDGGSTAP